MNTKKPAIAFIAGFLIYCDRESLIKKPAINAIAGFFAFTVR